MKSQSLIISILLAFNLYPCVQGMENEDATDKIQNIVFALSTPVSEADLDLGGVQERITNLFMEVDKAIGIVHVGIEEKDVIEGLVERMQDAFDVDYVILGGLSRQDDDVFMNIELFDSSNRSVFGSSVNFWNENELRIAVESIVRLIKPSTTVQSVSVGIEKKSGWKDGKYTGECTVWPAMKVEVVVKRGRLKSVNVLEDEGTPEFSKKVVDTLPDQMVKQNRIDVDGITAATLSSNNLKAAVRAALEQAN